MNKPLAFLLRCIGFNRPAPKTRLSRILRRSERTLTVLLLLYAGLHVFPQVLFAHSVSADGITLYSRRPLPPEAVECTKRAAALIQQSELAVPGRRERVFVCNSSWLFRLFKPTAGCFAFSVKLTDNVFIADGDFTTDVARWPAPEFNTRSLSGVIAHEITHGLIRNRLGLMRGVTLADWVNEGYCDYVAKDSSFPEVEGRSRFVSGEDHPSSSYRYFKYREMVRYLAESQRLSFAEIVARAGESGRVVTEARRAAQSGNP